MPMIFACGLNHHIDGTTQIPPQFLDDTNTKSNPVRCNGSREDQLYFTSVGRAAFASVQLRTNFVLYYASDQGHTLAIESYVQKAKGIADKLAALQHPVPNDDLVEFILAGLGPSYRPFTRLLLSEERQLKKRDEALHHGH
ncbi:hypothetical protein H5410_025664 [Solanum commersonii]|uniref:Uncharacterized protein n=1 Tax=Solanum commersonii TaxID=4109 RepID=A0A9J5YYM0_SOLCO|nr:hypothetical protein H5410_025664 [Solanum commersonii]